MRNHPFNRLLRSAAHEMGDGGGASTATTTPAAAAAVPPATAGPAAAVRQREPSMLEKVQAAVRDKGSILAENADLKKQVGQLTADLGLRDGAVTTLNQELVELRAENTRLHGELTSIENALLTTEANVVSIDAAAARQIAGMGFEAEKLPAAQKEGDSIESLEARLGRETDPQAIVALARQIDALKAKQSA